MKNSELVKYTGSILSEVDKQRRYVLLSLSDQQPCPNCERHQSVVDASGVESLDDFDPADFNDYGRGTLRHATAEGLTLEPARLEKPFQCYNCGRALRRVVPLVKMTPGGWMWQLVPEGSVRCEVCGGWVTPKEFEGGPERTVHKDCQRLKEEGRV